MSAQTRRVDRGRGHSYFLDGDPAIGITTALGEGFPKPALIGWAFNTARDYAIDHWDELSALSIAKRVKAISDSRYADRDAAANAGTKVHSLAHALALGFEVEVPDFLAGHVDAYLRFVEEWEPEEVIAEAVVLNRRFRYMGTLDLVADLADGNRWLLDFKTAKSGVFGENGLQLAAYRNAESYLAGTNAAENALVELPMPAVDRAGVIWVRSDGYDLVPVKAGEDEFRTFLYALGIARWRERDDIVGEALSPPTRGGGEE